MGNNCIGLLNHKFFILYLIYVVYFCGQIAGPFIQLLYIKDDVSDNKDLTKKEAAKGTLGILSLLSNYPNEFVVYCISNALILGLGFMLIY